MGRGCNFWVIILQYHVLFWTLFHPVISCQGGWRKIVGGGAATHGWTPEGAPLIFAKLCWATSVSVVCLKRIPAEGRVLYWTVHTYIDIYFFLSFFLSLSLILQTQSIRFSMCWSDGPCHLRWKSSPCHQVMSPSFASGRAEKPPWQCCSCWKPSNDETAAYVCDMLWHVKNLWKSIETFFSPMGEAAIRSKAERLGSLTGEPWQYGAAGSGFAVFKLFAWDRGPEKSQTPSDSVRTMLRRWGGMPSHSRRPACCKRGGFDKQAAEKVATIRILVLLIESRAWLVYYQLIRNRTYIYIYDRICDVWCQYFLSRTSCFGWNGCWLLSGFSRKRPFRSPVRITVVLLV